MRKLLIFILAMAAYGAWDQYHEAQPVAATAGAHNEIIMYSLTTCGYCKQKGRELKAAGIGFTEYFIDRDADRREELNRKLEQSGLPPQRYGTPIMDVRGTMLPNNPSLDVIRRYMGET
ncbi:MAG: glutaredoxin family protein [Thiohalobacteraceae bacterium]